MHRIALTHYTDLTLQYLPSFCMERFDGPDELKQVSDTEQRPVAADHDEWIEVAQVCKANGNRGSRPRIVVVVYALIAPVVPKVPDL